MRKRLIGMAVSGALLVIVYRRLEIPEVGARLAAADVGWLVAATAMIVPITLLRAWRFFWTVPSGARPGFGDATRLTLAASALNIVAPAKAGDLIKSRALATRSNATAGVSIAIVVYERLCDLVALSVWCVAGWLIGGNSLQPLPVTFWIVLASAGAVGAVLISSVRVADVWRRGLMRVLPASTPPAIRSLADGWPDLLRALGRRRALIVGLTFGLWLIQLLQIRLFGAALSIPAPASVWAGVAAVALMAGQLPLTFAGLGARDAALVILFSPAMTPEAAEAMSLLIATRSVLPALAGAPFVASVLKKPTSP
jgi:uncharacterized membrane protein YbhN (UPF0104 family)